MKTFSNWKSLGFILLAAIVGGGMPIFTKIGLREIPPLSFSFIRIIGATICLLPFFLKNKRAPHQGIQKIFLLSLLATGNIILFAYGLRLTTANLGQTIYNIVPILSAIISFFLLKERFSASKILGIVLGFIGAGIIVLLPLFSTNIDIMAGMTGNLLILIAAVSYSFYSVLSKRFQTKYSPVELTTYFLLTSLVVVGLLSLSDFKNNPQWWLEVTYRGVGALIYAAISTASYYLMIQYIIKHTTPVIASLVLYIQPLATFLLAFLFLGETLNSIFIFGFLLTIIGVWITTNSHSKKSPL